MRGTKAHEGVNGFFPAFRRAPLCASCTLVSFVANLMQREVTNPHAHMMEPLVRKTSGDRQS